jgi:hypothetical protein
LPPSNATARPLRCEQHTVDPDQLYEDESTGEVIKVYRDLSAIDYSGI